MAPVASCEAEDSPAGWGRRVPDVWQAQLLHAAGDTAVLLPKAKDPMLQCTDSISALHWVNSMPDDTRHAIIKHSQQVERQLAAQSAGQQLTAAVIKAYTPYMPSTDPSAPAVSSAHLLSLHPPGQYHLLAPRVVDVIQSPTCWSCQPKLDNEQWQQVLDEARRRQLAAAGHPMPQPQQHSTPVPALAIQAVMTHASPQLPALPPRDNDNKDQLSKQVSISCTPSSPNTASCGKAPHVPITTQDAAVVHTCDVQHASTHVLGGQQIIGDTASQLAAAGVLQDEQLQQHDGGTGQMLLPGYVQVTGDMHTAASAHDYRQQQWQQPDWQQQEHLHQPMALHDEQLMHAAPQHFHLQPAQVPEPAAQTKRAWRPWLCCGRQIIPAVTAQQPAGPVWHESMAAEQYAGQVPQQVVPEIAAAGQPFPTFMEPTQQALHVPSPQPEQQLQQQHQITQAAYSANVIHGMSQQLPAYPMANIAADAASTLISPADAATLGWNHPAGASVMGMQQHQQQANTQPSTMAWHTAATAAGPTVAAPATQEAGNTTAPQQDVMTGSGVPAASQQPAVDQTRPATPPAVQLMAGV